MHHLCAHSLRIVLLGDKAFDKAFGGASGSNEKHSLPGAFGKLYSQFLFPKDAKKR